MRRKIVYTKEDIRKWEEKRARKRYENALEATEYLQQIEENHRLASKKIDDAKRAKKEAEEQLVEDAIVEQFTNESSMGYPAIYVPTLQTSQEALSRSFHRLSLAMQGKEYDEWIAEELADARNEVGRGTWREEDLVTSNLK